MTVFEKYPKLSGQFEMLCAKRPDEIQSGLMEEDQAYQQLIRERSERSMKLKTLLVDTDADALFEAYSDSVYAQEKYEITALYRQALRDALAVLENLGAL